jgi:hypothetical protein
MNVSGFELTVKSAVYEYMDTASDQVYTFIVTPHRRYGASDRSNTRWSTTAIAGV